MQFVTCEQGFFMIDIGVHILQDLNQDVFKTPLDNLLCGNANMTAYKDETWKPKLWASSEELVESKGNLSGSLNPQKLVTMDMSHLDSASYLGVLVFVNLFYLSLIILLTWIVVRVRNNQDVGGLYNT